MKHSIIVFFCLFIMITQPAFSQSAERLGTVKETCKILATVVKTEQWLYAPYQEMPSTFSDIYTKLTLRLQKIDTYESYMRSDQQYCQGFEQGVDYTYKLCAPVRPQLGDVIRGVVAPPVGLTTEGCIFDIQILDNVKNATGK